MIRIDQDKCKGCKACYEVCPDYVFSLERFFDTYQVMVKRAELCCRCGHCVSVCPSQAISHQQYDGKEGAQLPPLSVPPDQVENLMLARRSIRVYKETPITSHQYEKLLRVATYAGTGSNLQEEGVVIVTDRTLIDKLEDLVIEKLWKAGIRYVDGRSVLSRLAMRSYPAILKNQIIKYHHLIKARKEDNALRGMIFRNAPGVIVIHSLKKNAMGGLNAGLAARNMELAALSMGLGTCHTGFLVAAASHRADAIHDLLGLDRSRQIQAGLMVGYPKYRYRIIPARKERSVSWLQGEAVKSAAD